MLETMHALAWRLRPLRVLFWLLAVAGICGFAASLIGPEFWQAERFTVLAITLLLWSVLGLGTVHGFAPPLPVAAAGAGRIERLGVAVQRGLLTLFALFLVGLALATLFASLRTAGMWLRAAGG